MTQPNHGASRNRDYFWGDPFGRQQYGFSMSAAQWNVARNYYGFQFWTPPTTPVPIIHYDMSDTDTWVRGDFGRVNPLLNKGSLGATGNGGQTVENDQPRVDVVHQNSLDTMRYDSEFYNINTITGLSKYTVIHVTRRLYTNDRVTAFSNTTNTSQMTDYYDYDEKGKIYKDASNYIIFGTPWVTRNFQSFEIMVTRFDLAEGVYNMYIAGESLGTPTITGTMSALDINAVGWGLTSNLCEMYSGELHLYNSYVSNIYINEICTALATKWDVPWINI